MSTSDLSNNVIFNDVYNSFVNSIKSNNENVPRFYIYFETLIRKLLEEYLKSQSKKIEYYGDKSDYGIDFFLPQGIDEIAEPLGVIVKLIKGDRNSFFAVIRRTCERIGNATQLKGLIFVIGDDVSDEQKTGLIRMAKKITGLDTYVWDNSKIVKIISEHSDFWNVLIKNVDEIFVDDVINRTIVAKPDQWREKRQDYIKQLAEAYKHDDLVLFLGAGVSKDANNGIHLFMIYSLP